MNLVCKGLLVSCGLFIAQHSVAVEQKAAPAVLVAQFGAIAVDEEFAAYGIAHNMESQEAAETEAKARANATGSGVNARVVLVWSGAGCGAYVAERVPHTRGSIQSTRFDASGWASGKDLLSAETKARAALNEEKPNTTAGVSARECNSQKAPALKTVYTAEKSLRSVEIHGQVWTATSLRVSKFRNGDPIPRAKSAVEFRQATTPAYFCYPKYCATHGYFYNGHAVRDPRNVAPVGWRIPSDEDVFKLIENLGGASAAVSRLRSQDGWPEWAGRASNPTGFNAQTGTRFSDPFEYYVENGFASSHFWSSTQNGNYQNQFVLKVYDDSQEIKLGNQGLNDGVVLRLIKGD